MKRILIWLLLLPVVLSGQNDAEFKLGTECKEAGADLTAKKICGIIDNKYIVYKTCALENSDYSITGPLVKKDLRGWKFDLVDQRSLSRVKYFQIIPDKGLIDLEMIYSGVFKDALYIFYSHYDKTGKKYLLKARTVNLKTYRLNEDGQTIAEIRSQAAKSSGRRVFEYAFSPDKSKFMVFSYPPLDEDGRGKLACHVFDKTLNLLIKKDLVVHQSGGLFLYQDIKISNEGNVYILAREYNDKVKDKVKGNPNYVYKLVCFSKDLEPVTTFEISLPQKFIQYIDFDVLSTGDLVSAGFYSLTTKKKWEIAGTFYYLFDVKNNDVKINKEESLDTDFLFEYIKERTKAGSIFASYDAGLDNYYMRDFIVTENGETFLVAERIEVDKEHSSSTSSGGYTSTTTNYYYEFEHHGIMVIKFNTQGETLWKKSIPKLQKSKYARGSTRSIGYMQAPLFYGRDMDNDNIFDYIDDKANCYDSYTAFYHNDKLFLVYNEAEKNINSFETKKIRSSTPPGYIITVMVEIDENGNLLKKELCSYKKDKMLLLPFKSMKVNDKELLLLFNWKKKQKYGRLGF